MVIMGIDPGLRHTGWGVVEKQGNSFHFLAAGTINPDDKLPLADRLSELFESLNDVFKLLKKLTHDEAAVVKIEIVIRKI